MDFFSAVRVCRRSGHSSLILCFLLITFIFVPRLGQAQVLIIQASDLHSQYDHLTDFIKSASEVRARFLDRYPDGRTLLILNGDVAGPSEWTDLDKGINIFKMLAHWSNSFDGFMMTLGNHDGWSFSARPNDANDSFYDQARQTQRWFNVHSKHSGRFSTANIAINPGYNELFQDGIDMKNSSGNTIRVTGLLLQDLFKVSGYDPNIAPNPIRGVTSMLETVKAQTEKAAAEGVSQLIFAAHEGNVWLKKNLLPEYLEWKNNHPNEVVRQLALPVFFAAHTHLVENSNVSGTHVIESGSRYKYSHLILSDSGSLLEHQFMDYETQREVARTARLSPESLKALEVMDTTLRKMHSKNRRVMVQGESLDVIRKDLRDGPHWMGVAIAETYRITAEEVRRNMNLTVDFTAAMFSSTAFRRDEPVLEERISRGHLKSFHPLPRPVSYAVMNVETFNKILAFLRAENRANGDFSPQLSPNIHEAVDGSIALKAPKLDRWSSLFVKEPSPRSLKTEILLVALDGFLGWQLETQERYKALIATVRFIQPAVPVMQNKSIAQYFHRTLQLPEIEALKPISCRRVHSL